MRVLRALTLLGGAPVRSARALTDLRRQYARIDRVLSRLDADVARMVKDTAHKLELLEERVDGSIASVYDEEKRMARLWADLDDRVATLEAEMVAQMAGRGEPRAAGLHARLAALEAVEAARRAGRPTPRKARTPEKDAPP